MAVGSEFREMVAGLLAPLGPVQIRPMFGGAGVYSGGAMFGLIVDDVLYFKVNEASRAAYESAGSGPFRYRTKAGERQLASYYRAPEYLLDEPDEMVAWAARSVAAAARVERRQRPRRRS